MTLLRSFAFAAAMLALTPAMAADITWSTGPQFGGPTGYLGILTNGTLIEAVHLAGTNGAPTTVDPGGLNLTFATVDSPWFNATFSDPPNGIGDAAWSAIVANFEWQVGTDVDAPTFLTGLTPGATYQVQFFAGRSHTCCGARTQTFGDGNGHFSDPITFTPGSYVSVVGTFVADAGTQHIVFDDSSNNPLLSAYVLREVSAIPEPSNVALMLAGLVGLVARRVRLA